MSQKSQIRSVLTKLQTSKYYSFDAIYKHPLWDTILKIDLKATEDAGFKFPDILIMETAIDMERNR